MSGLLALDALPGSLSGAVPDSPPGSIHLVRCEEPTDANFGGVDVLVRDGRGVLACIAEVPDVPRLAGLAAEGGAALAQMRRRWAEYVALRPVAT